MAGLISDDDVARLNSHSLPAVINALLTAEADLRHIPLTGLDLTLRSTDPDAGIDGRIDWPNGTSHDTLPPGIIAIQYKSGKFKNGELAKEFKKKGVQKTLKSSGGKYLLFVSHAYPVWQRNAQRRSLHMLCRRRHIRPDRCTILYADQIARWISRFPSVVIRPELGKGYPAFDTIEAWSRQPSLRNAFQTDPQR